MKINPSEIFERFMDSTLSFVDGLHKQGYLWYILLGIILFFILAVFFSRG